MSGLFGGHIRSKKMDSKSEVPITVLVIIFIIGVVVLSFEAYGLEAVVLSDEDYKTQCLDADFSPSIPCGPEVRPRSAPLDCSLPDFSPSHPFCTPERAKRDALAKCDGFSPALPGCAD